MSPRPTLEAILAEIRSGRRSARETAEAHLSALERVGAELNAVARLEPETALAAAHALDAARGPAGPLHGAPLAHKDLYARAGWRLEAGSAILAGHVAERTAHPISLLDRAGAMDLGRLNTVEFALGTEGQNVHTGPVRNPWNPAHIPGGSSSGSAVAVAAGAVPAALGSDTGGSIRLPAAACGIVGLKPTAGRIGRTGVFPLSGTLDTVGPLTGTVRDAALLLGALSGPDPEDPQSSGLPPEDFLEGIEEGLGGLAIGVARAWFFDPVEASVGAAIEAAIAVSAGEGAALRDVALPGIEVANRLAMLIINVEAATQHGAWLATRAGDYGPETLARMAAGLFVPAEAYLAALARRRTLLAEVLAAMEGLDAVLTPAWPMQTPTIAEAVGGARVEDMGHCSRPVNFLGLPAVVLPCGLSETGLPVGLQLVGRPFGERRLLRAARGLERALAFAESHRPQVTV